MIIGLCGPEGAGKSTAGKLLAESFDLPVVPMAGPLKGMLAALGIPDRHLWGTQAEKEMPLDMLGGKSARYAMQKLGTEWARDCMGTDFWADLWTHAIRNHCPFGAIADDIRFPNEVDRIRHLGGMVICIIREPGASKELRHSSENFRALQADVTIFNGGTVDALREGLRWAVRDYFQLQAAE